MSKSNQRVFQILSEMFNFKMSIRRATVWGRLRNKTWNGVVGLLNRSEIDFAISGLAYSVNFLYFLIGAAYLHDKQNKKQVSDGKATDMECTNQPRTHFMFSKFIRLFGQCVFNIALQLPEFCLYFVIRRLSMHSIFL